MPSTPVRTAAALSLVGALAACGGGSGSLDRDTAAQHSMNAVASDAQDPTSGIYHHRVQLQSARPYGKGGWFIRVADRTTGRPICVVDLPRSSSLGTEENITIVPCPTPSPLAPAKPVPANHPSA
jgi:hypothetical protein